MLNKLLNYLTLSQEEKIERVINLHSIRDSLRKLSKRARVAKQSKKSRRRKPVFFSDEIEKLFYSMSEEAQNFIIKGE